jgi:GTPase SAR1 family protein
MKTVLCPFCFNKFGAAQIEFRCTNSSCSDRTVDVIYDKYQGIKSGSPMGKVFTLQTNLLSKVMGRISSAREAKCPTCTRTTAKRVCPICHFELMYDTGTTQEEVIAVIGGVSTGKSSYISVLIQRLKNEVGADFNAAIMAIGDSTRERYRNDFYKPIYQDRTIVKKTQSGALNSRTKIPMVFRITIDDKGRRRAVNLVLFDTAGEDMGSMDLMSTEARYILYSDAIIFLLDPLQIDSVREQLPKADLPIELPDAAPLPIVERLYELHQQHFNMKSEEKIKKPIAFALAKIDALYSIIDPSSVLRYTSNHQGALNLSDTQSVHTEISSYLQAWLGPNFNNLTNIHFKNYKYFGLSALGAPPVNGNVGSVSPLRVEDPLLWILSELSLIKTKR